MRVVGVDGCRQGWVTISVALKGAIRADVFERFSDLMARFKGARVLAVDMPLGLLEKGCREADESARRYLGRRASSVFSAPCEGVLGADTYESAGSISRRMTKKGISRQTWALVPKIRELQEFAGDGRIHEVHPEVSFRLMNEGSEVSHGKKTWGGLWQRLELLASAGVMLAPDLGAANAVPVDDVVDAAAAAWSALRIAKGEARSFPDRPVQRSAQGRLVTIAA